MISLPSALEVLQKVRLQLHMGKSLSSSLESVLESRNDPFSKSLRIWLIKTGAGQDQAAILETLPCLTTSPHRAHLVHIFERGLTGASIDDVLSELEQEFYFTIENNFERKLQTLPLKLLIPLTLFILPAVMGIIIGPFLFSMKGG